MKCRLLPLLLLLVNGCALDGKTGSPGPDGLDGSNCFDALGDQDGDGELTQADCLWAAICPSPVSQMADLNGDGAVNVADCRESLRGPMGEPGTDGTDGMNGRDGRDGRAGNQGPAGADGRDGRDGTDGEAGPAGTDGQNGMDGDPGQPGMNGEDGAEGPQGRPGADGDDGDDGDDGARVLGPEGDVDGDGVLNAHDNCVFSPNAEQADHVQKQAL